MKQIMEYYYQAPRQTTQLYIQKKYIYISIVFVFYRL